MILPSHWRSILLAPVLFASCARQNALVATPRECIRVSELHLTRETRAVLNATLILKVDTRRRRYDAHDFCAFQQPTSTGAYSLLTVYDKVGNHQSPTWMLLSRTGAIDTQLTDYQMAHDSLRTADRIRLSVTRLPGLDERARQELIQLMQQDARRSH